MGFAESIDFTEVIRNDNNPNQAGAPTHHIALSVDCVKHFAMMANTEKGRLVRKYFIQAEKELKQQKQKELPQSHIEALEALVKATKEIIVC